MPLSLLPEDFAAERPMRVMVLDLACFALLATVFASDLVTPLGYAVWVLYLLPVGLTLFQPKPWTPIGMAIVAVALIVAGFFGSPPGGDPSRAVFNRTLASIALIGLALVIHHTLRTREAVRRMSWVQRGEARIAQALLGEQTVAQVADQAARGLAEWLDAASVVLYRREGEQLLRAGGHAFDHAAVPERIALPEGLVGQVAAEGKLLIVDDVPAGHLPLVSALGRSAPRRLVIAPLVHDGRTVGIVEMGSTHTRIEASQTRNLLARAGEAIAIALRSALYRERLQQLLEETQRQSEELQSQQEELRVSNEELEAQSQALRHSQAQLETQQVELQQTNVQLEEQASELERQKESLLSSQQALQMHAEKLENASRYKSEFLANMSHELRTPLNSSLILAKLLADNKPGTLNAEQVKFAEAIHSSNNDLLALINDILDLSKIEAGHVDLRIDTVMLSETVQRLQTMFEPLARQKGLGFSIVLEEGAPPSLSTDGQRLEQILKNLLANALKFTERGAVAMKVRALPGDRLAFAVEDSGVGIAKHQQAMIFEAFRQADGSTSRRFGGTGLGLSISRELASHLGGAISVDSEPGRGSVFTLALPRTRAPAAAPATANPANVAPAAPPASPAPAVPPSAMEERRTAFEDDRAHRQRAGRMILAVEDDPAFGRVLYDLAHELGFDCAVATSGSEALRLARELAPNGILLDIGLPDQSGLTVLERLKRDPATRHVPVHMVSGHEKAQTALELGAVGFLQKTADRTQLAGAIRRIEDRLQQRLRRVLVVEDDEALRRNLVLLLQTEEVSITAVGSMAEALQQLSTATFDCMVTDLTLPDGTGYDLLEKMAEGEDYAFPPVIVYTGRALSRDEEQHLRRYSKSIIVKGARSPERLLDEVTLFLHSVEASLPPEKQRLLRAARQRDAVLEGRRILLVEDDVRNIFALTSVFEPLGVHLTLARNGREALAKLEETPDVDLVLMDIMMPEMDGITATRHIRQRPEWSKLPIIALTAKAMADDRERCLEAGANDYVAKPIDVDKLVSLTRVWMPR